MPTQAISDEHKQFPGTVKLSDKEDWLYMIKLALEHSSEAIVIADLEGAIIYANPASEAMYGFEPEELAGQSLKILDVQTDISESYFITEIRSKRPYISPPVERAFGFSPEEMVRSQYLSFIHPDDHAAVQQAFAGYLQQNHFVTEFRMRTKSGRYRWVRTHSRPSRKQGLVAGLQGVLTDITDRKHAEAALKESAEEHRSILQTAMDGFWLADVEGRLLEVNESYCRMSGYSERELLRMCISDLDADMTPHDAASHMKRISVRGGDRFESRHRRKNGTFFDVEVSVQYRKESGGRFGQKSVGDANI